MSPFEWPPTEGAVYGKSPNPSLVRLQPAGRARLLLQLDALLGLLPVSQIPSLGVWTDPGIVSTFRL